MSHQASAPGARIFLVAAEESGDRLGASLMRELRGALGDGVTFSGVGGRAMAEQGLATLFPIDELSIMGFASIPRKLPMIFRRIRQATRRACLQAKPDVLVIIDSPDFTQRVARRVRARDPSIPIVDYVSPSVWAWRPGRARAIARYVDQPAGVAAVRAGGSQAARRPALHLCRSSAARAARRPAPESRPSRSSASAMRFSSSCPAAAQSRCAITWRRSARRWRSCATWASSFKPVLPALPHLANLIHDMSARWPVRPRIVVGDDERRAAFRTARAALAKSGTVTLELALSGVPMVTAYRGTAWEAFIARRLVQVSSVILANLVLGENAVPEFLQEDCTADRLAPALHDLMQDGDVRQHQLDAFTRLDRIMSTGERSPSQRAADAVIATMRR